MRLTTSQRLDSAHTALAALGCYAALATAGMVGFAVAYVAKPAPAEARFATTEARTAYAKCGAYDVLYVAHDWESVSDAKEAAFANLSDGCEVGRGNGQG